MPFKAKVPKTFSKGLAGQKKINEPMLFEFPDEKVRAICMKRMLAPVDIVWADKNGTITKIYLNCPIQDQTKQYSSITPAMYAIECAEGDAARLGLTEGKRIRILRK